MSKRIQCEVRVGTGKNARQIGSEGRHLFGPVEGWWFIGLFWFAIAVLAYNLVWPWCYETATGQSWRFRQQAAQSAVVGQQPTTVPPETVQQVSPPAVYVPAAPSVPVEPVELSPEELDRLHTEYLRSRGQ
ncbi:MAG: hypothetical protein AAB941_00445 [Patescibacteria group bacterium]|mgnify:CR=1 FL=1